MRAQFLKAIYGIPSEQILIEQLDYNLHFRCFVGLNPDNLFRHPSSLTSNRYPLLNEELMANFLELLLTTPEFKLLLSCSTSR